MAIETVTILKDDLTGKPGEDVETVSFGYKGTAFELELSDESEKELAALLDPYIKVARRVQGSTGSKSTGTSNSDPTTPKVRAWAQSDAGSKLVKSKGLKVPADRGRIDGEVRELWKAQGKPTA